LRLNCPAFMVFCPLLLLLTRGRSALALPDQDQADRAEHGAIARPLQLIDHEALRRPGKRASTLADPQQPDGEREETNDQERSGHGSPPVAAWHGCVDALGDGYRETIAKDDLGCRSNTMPVSAARAE